MLGAIAVSLLAAVKSNALRAEGNAASLKEAVTQPDGTQPAGMTMDVFLDRLMRAESGGHDTARNPLSTALGPYQFIASTWLMLAHRVFGPEIEGLNAAQILALRTDRRMARRAADAYTRENAAYLAAHGQPPTFPNLRLAFLVGAGGAAKVLAAPVDARAVTLLGPAVIGTNPFMTTLTAGGIILRAARDIATSPLTTAGITPEPQQVFAGMFDSEAMGEFAAVLAAPIACETAAALYLTAATGRAQMALAQRASPPPKATRPKIEVECDLSRTACRRWLSLAERRLTKKVRRAAAPQGD